MSKQSWLIILFGLGALIFLLAAAGPIVGINVTAKAEPWGWFFIAAGFLVEHLP